jgi:hypothetical protein
MTDYPSTIRDVFARDALERSERLSLAVTMVWFALAVLAMVLVVGLATY